MLIGHKKKWEFLKKKFEQNQLSHAYLFSGAKYLGKKTFAKEFAEFVGCKFPDLMIVSQEDGKEIPIAKIREVQNFLSYKSYNGGFKIVIVDNAHLMNQEAQSCFLKTLEEPKGRTLLVLISSKPDMLLHTILSRCQTIKFFGKPVLNQQKVDEENKVLQDLLKVAECDFSEKFKYVKSLDFEHQSASEIVEVLQKYLRHLLMIKIGAEKADAKDAVFTKYPIDRIKNIINLTENINNKLIFTNANPKLALEILLTEI